MTSDEELDRIGALGRAAGRAAAATAPLSPALRDHLNTVMQDAVRTVARRYQEDSCADSEPPARPRSRRPRRTTPS
jgi:hypothetical protein